MDKLRELQVKFSFVKMGTIAGTEENPIEPNKIYLDVGNSLQRGVLDHHQDGLYRSASEVVFKRPELVLENIESQAEVVEIVVHTNPDLDAVVSAYLTKYIIEYSVLPAGAEELVEYVSLVDQGAKFLDPEKFKTPFTAVAFLNEKINREVNSEEERNQAIIKIIFPLVGELLENINKGIDVDSENSLGWDSEPLVSLIPEIEKDINFYFQDLKDSEGAHNTEITSVLLPSHNMTEWDYVDAVFIDDPSSALFSYYARRDRQNSPGKKGFVLTMVYNTRTGQVVIANDAAKKYSLAFLGGILEFEETLTRRNLAGGDIRLWNKRGELRKKRPGYHNPDPWYDGKGHNYTILGSPRNGTVLSSKKIRNIISNYTEQKD